MRFGLAGKAIQAVAAAAAAVTQQYFDYCNCASPL